MKKTGLLPVFFYMIPIQILICLIFIFDKSKLCTFENMKYLILFLIPVWVFAQDDNSNDRTIEYLTESTWNIAYNITPEGERMDEEDQEKIKSSWVIFRKDSKYEMPGGITGKTIGKWTYDAPTRILSFEEGRTKYKAIIEEISDMNLLLDYKFDGGFKIGLIHYVYIPTPKTEEEIISLLTSGRWNVVLQQFESIEDKTPADQVQNSWFEFNSNKTYQRSEYTGEDKPTVRDGYWYLDDELRLNLDGNEMWIYSVAGDKSNLILTSTTDGIRIINCKKAK